MGHYEGDTLVIDTVGQKVGPLSMVDYYGTPFSPALHVIERYRLIDGEAARVVHRNYYPDRASAIGGPRDPFDPDMTKKGLQVEVTVEDPGMFTTPWSGLVTFRPTIEVWEEEVCAEQPFIGGKEVKMPRADRPDF